MHTYIHIYIYRRDSSSFMTAVSGRSWRHPALGMLSRREWLGGYPRTNPSANHAAIYYQYAPIITVAPDGDPGEQVGQVAVILWWVKRHVCISQPRQIPICHGKKQHHQGGSYLWCWSDRRRWSLKTAAEMDGGTLDTLPLRDVCVCALFGPKQVK